jgi:HEAT repeat protein
MEAHRTPRRTSPARASAAANNTAEWFRQAERLVRLARARGADDDEAAPLTERLVESFAELVEYHAPIVLRCSPLELWLRDELILHHTEGVPGQPIERGIPFLLFRDGIRGLTLDTSASRHDARTLLAALVRVAATPATHEDLTTLLWRADLDGLRVELAPFEETVPGSRAPEAARGTAGLALVAARRHPQAWPDEGTPLDVDTAWSALEPGLPAARQAWREAWTASSCRQWTERAEALVHDVLAHDSAPLAREALTTTLCSWLAGAAQRCDWHEAALAHDNLRHVDPERRWSGPLLAAALGELDAELVAERLDEADRETQGRFFAFAVRVGQAALDLIVRVLARASRQRVRAAATTALSYVCADNPAALAPYLRDARWQVARNVVFALGQLGGEETGEPLALALQHADVRVRRAAVSALGQVPVHHRTPLLLRHLDTTDPATLTAVLAMLAREPDRRASAALMQRIAGADFESRPEEVRLALVSTLGELADAQTLPVLNGLLVAGGWFARRTPERDAAALALARIGTPEALDLLYAGLRARADAVRVACQYALDTRQQRTA